MTSVFERYQKKQTQEEIQPLEKDAPETGVFERYSKTVDEPKPKEKTAFEKFSPEGREYGGATEMLKQQLLGLAKLGTFPLDLIKKSGLELSEMGLKQAQKKGDLEAYEKIKAEMERFGEEFPSQAKYEKKFTEATGIETAPQSPEGEFARETGEFGGGFFGTLGALGKEGLEAVGVPQWLSTLLAAGGSGIASASRKGVPTKAGQATELEKIAQREGLPQMAMMEKPVESVKKAIVPEAKKESLATKLDQSTREAVENVVERRFPMETLEKKGIDYEDAANFALDSLETKVANSQAKVNSNSVLDWVKNKREQITKSAPQLSKADEKVISELNNIESNLSKAGAEELTAEQWIKQFRNWNKDSKALYKTPEFKGFEADMHLMYTELKEEAITALEKSGQKDIADALRESNKLYSESMKLNRVGEILEPVFFKEKFDLNALNRILKNKNTRKQLEIDLGKEGTKQLKDIAKYGRMANDRIKALKTSKSLEEQINKLGVVGAIAFPFIKGVKLPQELYRKATGYILTKPKLRADLEKIYREVGKKGLSKSLPALSANLERDIESEYGSVDNFLKIIESDIEND